MREKTQKFGKVGSDLGSLRERDKLWECSLASAGSLIASINNRVECLPDFHTFSYTAGWAIHEQKGTASYESDEKDKMKEKVWKMDSQTIPYRMITKYSMKAKMKGCLVTSEPSNAKIQYVPQLFTIAELISTPSVAQAELAKLGSLNQCYQCGDRVTVRYNDEPVQDICSLGSKHNQKWWWK